MSDEDLSLLSQRVGAALKAAGIKLVTAESCTGGWIAEVITQTAGSSAWFDSGVISYSNSAKRHLLGVAADTIRANGAVSEATASEMASGALTHNRAGIALAVTGIAGPDGGTPEKPVGTVCFGWCRRNGKPQTSTQIFSGDRTSVRRQSVVFALEGMLQHLAQP
jgi:nicotinamide-nucleotide amidase